MSYINSTKTRIESKAIWFQNQHNIFFFITLYRFRKKINNIIKIGNNRKKNSNTYNFINIKDIVLNFVQVSTRSYSYRNHKLSPLVTVLMPKLCSTYNSLLKKKKTHSELFRVIEKKLLKLMKQFFERMYPNYRRKTCTLQNKKSSFCFEDIAKIVSIDKFFSNVTSRTEFHFKMPCGWYFSSIK